MTSPSAPLSRQKLEIHLRANHLHKQGPSSWLPRDIFLMSLTLSDTLWHSLTLTTCDMCIATCSSCECNVLLLTNLSHSHIIIILSFSSNKINKTKIFISTSRSQIVRHFFEKFRSFIERFCSPSRKFLCKKEKWFATRTLVNCTDFVEKCWFLGSQRNKIIFL